MSNILEIACFDLESACTAQSAGADRIELCVNYPAGGLTPSEELILGTRKKIQIPLQVIIRPREGNFVYSENEIEEMKASVLFCKENLIDGIVFGCLTNENKIDEGLCKELLKLAQPMSVTFHRAIDVCSDLTSEIQKLIDLGFDRILSSGGKANAFEGKGNLKDLQNKFRSKICLMPGGGIRSGNISEIRRVTDCQEYHSAAIVGNSTSCDPEEIKQLKKIIHSL